VRRVVVAAALAVSAVVVLAGCQGTTSVAPSPVRSTDLTSSDGGFAEHAVVGVVLRSSATTPDDAGDGASRAARFETALTEAGFRPDVRVAGADEAASQRSAVRALVRAGAKALLVDAADPSSLATELRTAHDAGVVVVALGDALPTRASGGAAGGFAADYRVPEEAGQGSGASSAPSTSAPASPAPTTSVAESDLVDRSVAVVRSLQRGQRPDGG
jgi:ABC-type sugar transport system substrate-binding protein